MNAVPVKAARTQAIKAGVLYFAGVFAAGFALGVLRTLILSPWAGETLAVVIELPFILAFSWVLCARATARLGVSRLRADRAVMGITAFICLLLAEFCLWQLIYGGPPINFFTRYSTFAGLLGLAGQVVFAAFPLVQLKLQGAGKSIVS